MGARYKFGGPLSTELRHFSRLGLEARCEHPERVPLYIDNLCRLGLTELRPVRIADDTRRFRALEESADVKAAIARVRGQPAAAGRSRPAQRRRQSCGGRPATQGALRDRVRPPVSTRPASTAPSPERASLRRSFRMEAAPPLPRRRPLEREPLSLGEIRDVWPLLAPDDRIDGFLLLPREDAEDFFIALSARDQAELVLRHAGARAAPWMRLLEPDDVADVIQEAADEQPRRAARPARRADPQGGHRAARLRRGRGRRPDVPALRPAAPGDDGRRGDQLPAPAGAREAETIYYAYVARCRAAPARRGVVPRAVRRRPSATRVADDHGDRGRPRLRRDGPGDGRRIFAQSHLVALPVVDGEGQMKGIVTVDDIVDVVQEEATEDIQKFGGMEALDVPYLQIELRADDPEARGWLTRPVHRRDADRDRDRLLRARDRARRRARAVPAAHHLERRQLGLAGVHAGHPRDGARRGPRCATGGA